MSRLKGSIAMWLEKKVVNQRKLPAMTWIRIVDVGKEHGEKHLKSAKQHQGAHAWNYIDRQNIRPVGDIVLT